MDPELKARLEKALEAIGTVKDLQAAINEIKAWGVEKGRLSEAEKAVREVNDAIKAMQADVGKKIEAMRRQVFDGKNRYRGSFASEAHAAAFALNVMAKTAKDDGTRKRASEMLVAEFKELIATQRAGQTGEESLVGHEDSTRIQRLVEDYGFFAQRAYRMPMSEDTLTFHRRKTGLRAHKSSLRTKITEQYAGWAPLNLTAVDWDILVSYPNNLAMDALVSIAELLIQELALGFAIALDEDALVGDGSTAYDSEIGLTQLLLNLYGTGGGVGLVLASGNAWSEITEADILKTIGQVRYARPGQIRLTCSNEFFWQVLARIQNSKGGVTMMETAQGPRPQFQGKECDLSPAMPRSEANSQVPLLVGDIYQSSTLGDRMRMEIRSSTEVRFESKETVILASARYALNHHAIGDATTPGPVVGLVTAAS